MTVYVDDMKAKFGRMIMCHMIATDENELHLMAEKIGVARKWHQKVNTHKSHYDIALSKKALAIQHGAIEITWRQTAIMTIRRKETGVLGTPEDCESWYEEHSRTKKQLNK